MNDADNNYNGPIRLEDLADLAGVSVATVSRALNDSPLVSQKTRDRVQKLARRHHYQGRSGLSRRQTASQTPKFSVIIPAPQGRDARMTDPFMLQLFGGVADAAESVAADLVMPHRRPSDEDAFATLLEQDQSDGLLILGQSRFHEQLNRLADAGRPLVVWGAQLDNQRYCTVGSDNFEGGRRATNHLIRLGSRRLAFLGQFAAPEVRLRLEGYRAALRDQGLREEPGLLQDTGLTVDSALDAVSHLINSRIGFDGIVAASDLVALGAIQALERRGASVPGDVKVIGYDDIEMATYSSPPLTTVQQDVFRAGRLMVLKLLRQINGETVQSEKLTTDVIVRQSCGA